MPWGLFINSVDRTSLVDHTAKVDIEFLLNERATARFTCLSSFVPDRLADVRMFAQDGATLLFGGLVQQRRTVPRPNKHDHYRTVAECSDYGLYAEWCYQTKTYVSSTVLSSVLKDLVTDKLSAYGISLHAGQVAGPGLAPFAWTAFRVSDALRELSDRTGYVWQVWPDKTLEMFVPGTDSAPHSLTDANPHCLQLHWNDPPNLSTNRVVVVCGPAATATIEQQWVASGSQYYWTTDIPAGGGTSGYVTVNSIFLTVGSPASYVWDQATSRLTLGTASTPTAGQVIALNYVAQYPFTVTAGAGGSPTIEALYTAPDITAYDQGLEMAQGLLAQLGSVSAELAFLSKDTGWLPGQELPIVCSPRDVNATYVTTAVRLHLSTDARWLSDVEAVNASVYGGSYLERWREMRGQGSSSGVSVLPSGTTGTPPVSYLGGSRFHAVQV